MQHRISKFINGWWNVGKQRRHIKKHDLSYAQDASYVEKLLLLKTIDRNTGIPKNPKIVRGQHHPGHNHEYAYLCATITLVV
jgi:hypothetical protein